MLSNFCWNLHNISLFRQLIISYSAWKSQSTSRIISPDDQKPLLNGELTRIIFLPSLICITTIQVCFRIAFAYPKASSVIFTK